MFLVSIIIGLLIAGLVCAYMSHRTRDIWNNWGLFAWLCLVFAVVCIIIGVSYVVEYHEFMNAFENMREYYTSISSEFLNSDVYSIVDMLEANRELIELQSSREFWGFWSLIPEEILDIAPIGAG